MTTFTVWKFDTPDGAEHAAEVLKDAEKDRLVKIVDHAVVSWPQGASKPDTKIGHEEALRGTGWGAFWGLSCSTRSATDSPTRRATGPRQ